MGKGATDDRIGGDYTGSTAMTKPESKNTEPPRRPGLRALAQSMPRVAAAAGIKRGFGHGALFSRWSDIVGAMLAQSSMPERLTFARGRRDDGTLHIRVEGALALELQHLESLVIERINGFFGYRAVARLALRQGPLPRAKRTRPAPAPRRLTEEEDRALSARVAAVADPELRAGLERLGRSLLAHAPDPGAPPVLPPPRKKA